MGIAAIGTARKFNTWIGVGSGVHMIYREKRPPVGGENGSRYLRKAP
jgi:hypothetical protein